MQDNEGHPPNDSELTQISAGLNQFHDIYAIHQTEAQKFLLFGRLCLEYLVQEELFETFVNEKLSKGGRKVSVDFDFINRQMV